MIVFVESNFVLEWTLRQPEIASVEGILDLAESNKIELCIPAFALFEPVWTLSHRDSDRTLLHQRIAEEIRQQGRSDHRESLARLLGDIQSAFRQAVDEDLRRHVELLERATVQFRILELNGRVLTNAVAIQGKFNLKFQDAIILACVLNHLESLPPNGSRMMISKDRDFAKDEIRDALAIHGCTIRDEFAQALADLKAETSEET